MSFLNKKKNLLFVLLLILFSCKPKGLELDAAEAMTELALSEDYVERLCSGEETKIPGGFFASLLTNNFCPFQKKEKSPWKFTGYKLLGANCFSSDPNPNSIGVKKSLSLSDCFTECSSRKDQACLSFFYQKKGFSGSGRCVLYKKTSTLSEAYGTPGTSEEHDFKWCFSRNLSHDFDEDKIPDIDDPDDDNDGILDYSDACILSIEKGWVSDYATDENSDGCHDEKEALEDDTTVTSTQKASSTSEPNNISDTNSLSTEGSDQNTISNLSDKNNPNSDTNQIDTNQIDTNEIDTNQIDTNQIDTNQIDTNQIDTNKIDTNQIDTNQIDTNQIDTNQIDTNEIDTNEIDTNEEEKSTCGNGTQETNEECDDANMDINDGCDESCLVENGYDCSSGICCVTDTYYKDADEDGYTTGEVSELCEGSNGYVNSNKINTFDSNYHDCDDSDPDVTSTGYCVTISNTQKNTNSTFTSDPSVSKNTCKDNNTNQSQSCSDDSILASYFLLENSNLTESDLTDYSHLFFNCQKLRADGSLGPYDKTIGTGTYNDTTTYTNTESLESGAGITGWRMALGEQFAFFRGRTLTISDILALKSPKGNEIIWMEKIGGSNSDYKTKNCRKGYVAQGIQYRIKNSKICSFQFKCKKLETF